MNTENEENQKDVKTGRYNTEEVVFRDYAVKEYIGEGGYGCVYRVSNGQGSDKALKVLHSDVKLVSKAMRGIEDIRSINSVHLISIEDYGKTVDSKDCILMEYVRDNLYSVLQRKGSFSEEQACHLFAQLLKVLEVLEKYGIVHMNIKPGNLFLVDDVVKIGDFSMARFTSGASQHTSKTGTVEYMAPECFDENHGAASDRWSAAMVLFKMLTGQTIFKQKNQYAEIKAIAMNEADLSGVPEKYHDFFKKSFEKYPQDRHKNAVEMLEAFKVALQGDSKFLKKQADNHGVSSGQEGKRPIIKKEKLKNKFEFRQHRFLFFTIFIVIVVCSFFWFKKVIFYPQSLPVQPQSLPAPIKSLTPPPQSLPAPPQYSLRSKPTMVSDEKSKEVFGLDKNGKPLKYVNNKYHNNGDGTITDNATGLMWQQSGSSNSITYEGYEGAQSYIKQTNRDRYAGYSDWRLPTIPELMALLEPQEKNDDLYIDAMFDTKQKWCWSSDHRSSVSVWYVNFGSAGVRGNDIGSRNYVRAVRVRQ